MSNRKYVLCAGVGNYVVINSERDIKTLATFPNETRKPLNWVFMTLEPIDANNAKERLFLDHREALSLRDRLRRKLNAKKFCLSETIAIPVAISDSPIVAGSY